jgi:predicted dehydrogenase
MDTKIEAIGAKEKKAKKTLRLGFIGMGGIANHHANFYKKMGGVDMVCGCDIRQAALDHFKTNHGITNLYLDFKKMLKEFKDVQAIDVCTPNGVHCAAAVAAAEAGKDVFCEKPMAMSAKEAQLMADAAKRNKVNFVMGFQHRYEPRSFAIREQVEAGRFGKILYVRAQALRRRGIPNWGVFGQKKLQGGGPMIDIGVHILDTAYSMIGFPKPISATGNTFTFLGNKKSKVKSQWANWDHKTYTVEDMAVGMVRLDSGAMLTVEASFVAHIPNDVFNIQILGEKGGAIWDPPQISKDQDGYMMNMTPGFVGKSDNFEKKMQHFVEVCRDGRTNEAPGEHGLMVQKILDGVYASAEAGKEVTIE